MFRLSFATWLPLIFAAFGSAQPNLSPEEKPALGPPAKLLNAEDIRSKLGLSRYKNVPNLAAIKVAVLDFGFEGVDPRKLNLPPGSSLIEHYDADWVKANNLGAADYRKGFEPGNSHGRFMAQSAWAAAGNAPEGPVFLLLNANGPTLFRRAVKYAIEQKVDVILFSGHFEGGGNYDGRGPINAAVDEAIRAGIIWVNAAGNHRGRVYNGSAVPAADSYLRFGTKKAPELKFINRLDENNFTITLTWNDYREKEDAGTSKDLDLIVEDSNGKEVGRSAFKQIEGDKPAADGESRNPREKLTLPALGSGTYRIRVKAAGGNFTAADRIRILLSPARGDPYPHPDTGKPIDPVQFLDGSVGEELYPPADNARVLTVGDQSDYSALGPTADRRMKPDLLVPVLPAKWSNGETAGGTSYGAAFFAGTVCLLKATKPELKGDDLMRWLAEIRKTRPKGQRPEPVPWRTPTERELAGVMAQRR